MKFIIALYLIITTVLYAYDKTPNITIKSAVTFNTLCAKCHEGQCSGRLTFDTGSEATSNHIKRYSDDVNISKHEIKEFFTLLNYMKTECALWMPSDGKWKSENLSRFALSTSKGYFIPLGLLKKGQYHIEIKLKDDIHFRVEVLSDHFEHFLDISACPDGKKQILQFSIKKEINTFLRIQSRIPLQIVNLNIKKDN